MTFISIRSARADDVSALTPVLRQSDKTEILFATGEAPDIALNKALRRNGTHLYASIKGAPLALFGIADMNGFSKIGSPWLVGSSLIEEHPMAFLKKSRDVFEDLIQNYDYLINMVHHEHHASIQWLKWLGFHIHPMEEYGPYQQNFHRFDMSVS